MDDPVKEQCEALGGRFYIRSRKVTAEEWTHNTSMEDVVQMVTLVHRHWWEFWFGCATRGRGIAQMALSSSYIVVLCCCERAALPNSGGVLKFHLYGRQGCTMQAVM